MPVCADRITEKRTKEELLLSLPVFRVTQTTSIHFEPVNDAEHTIDVLHRQKVHCKVQNTQIKKKQNEHFTTVDGGIWSVDDSIEMLLQLNDA